jgi:serine/threonine-protein kinase
MKKASCFGTIIYIGLLLVAFAGSSYFWFTFFVRGKSLPTPNLVGREVADGRAIASDLGLRLDVDNRNDRNSDQVPRGAIVWQNQSGGNLVKRGTRLIVGQSLGPLVLEIPDLAGQSARTAMLRFGQRNLRFGNLAYVDVDGTPGVVATDPPKGTIVKGETPISILVAFPPPPPRYVMPDLIDRNVDGARSALDRYGMTATNVKFESYPGIANGTIIRQFPLPGAPVSSRDPISLVVSRQEDGQNLAPLQ